MNVEQIYANADLSRGLAAATLPTDTTEFDTINTKIAGLDIAKSAKLDALTPKTPTNLYAPELEDATIKGFVDADTAMLTDGTLLRVSSPLQRYDTAELPHEYKGILPEWAAKNLPSWVPGTGNVKKSDYASDKQREQAALLKMKNIGDVTQQDVYDVGNRAQLQTVADLNLAKGQERQLLDMNSGGDIVDLSDKASSLNLKVKIEKNRTTVNGRQLSPLYNAETGQNVTEMHANDPLMNAFAPNVPEPAQFSLKNVTKGAASGAVQVAGGLADTVISGAAYGLKEVTSAIGHPELYSAEDRDTTVKFLDKYKGSKWANELTGYDPKYNQAQLGKSLEAFKDGDFVGGLASGAKAAPGTFADSLAYMAAVTTGTGTVGMIMSEINNSLEDFGKNNKRDITSTDVARIAALDSAKVLLERLPFVHAIEGKAATVEAIKNLTKSMPEASRRIVLAEAAKRAGLVGLNMAEEGLQEGAQDVIDYYNREYKTDADKGLSVDELYKNMIGGAGAGGMAGSVGQVRDIASMSGLTDSLGKVASKVNDKLTTGKETKVSAPAADESRSEASPEDKTHMVNILEALDNDKFDYTANTRGTLEDINRAEDTLSRVTKTNDNAEIIADAKSRLSSAKARALKLVDNSDAEDFKLGSREDAEALLEFTLENSSKEEVVSRDAKMMKIAEQFGLEKEYKHLKDYYSVEKEAVEGDRGYKGYEKQLKAILASDKPDTKEVTKIVKRLQNYYQQENSYVQALTAGIKEAEAIASAHNRNATLGKPAQYEVTIPGQKVNKPWKINFEEVNGKYVVPAVTHNMLETKKRNVEGIVRALAEGGAKAKAKKLEVNTGTSLGITIPMATTGKAKNVEELNKYREMDANRYDKLGVTKVILGLKHDKKWDTYRKLNESKINQGVYTRDDVVVLNVAALEVNGKKTSLDTSTAREVKAAMKAGATIVIDSGIYGKDAKGKGAGKLHTQLTLLLSRYSSPNNKYGIVAKADGNTKGSHVFKPKEIADVENTKAIETKKIDKETKATKQKALDALVLAIANGEDTKELAVEAAKYFNVSKDGTSAKQNTLIHANNVLSKEIEAGAVEWYDVVKEEYGADATDADIHDMLDNKEGAIKLEAPIGGHKAISSAAIKAKVVERVVELFNVRREALQLMAEWKQLVEEQRIGDKDVKDLPKWLASKGYEAKEAFDLSESIAKGLEAVKVKLDADGKQIAVKRGKQSLKDGELLQTLELDITKIMQISKTTVLNTIDLDTIFKTAPELEREVDSAIASIEKAINLDGLRDNSRAEDAAKDKMTKQEFILKDAPGLALLLTSDGKVNKQTVTAIVLALYNGYQNDGYMLNGKPKSNEDVAAMLGMRAAELPKGTAKLVAEKGMLTKSFATDLRKDIANLLGISRISDEGEARRFDQAMTDLAQVAIMVGVDKDILVLDDEMTTADYAEKVLGLDKNEVYTEKGTTVSFIKLSTPTAVEDMPINYKELVADLPMEDSYRNDVRFNKPSDKEIERVLEEIKNDLSGGKIPETAKKLLRKGMKAEHIVNTAMIKDLLQPEYVDLIKDRMGWIAISTHKTPNAKYDALSKDKKDIQEAINRDVEKEIAELTRIVEMTDKEEMSLYFMMYYTKNGRYMYDSNTLNPQTNKQLTRWLIQPKDHQNEVSYEDGKFVVDGKDATDAYMFALGQAFGYGVDKKNFKNTKLIVGEIVATLMDKNNKQLDTLFKDMLANEDVAVGNRKVEIEHIAHAHQAIAMLRELKANGRTTSSLTAEIDAKTSGFGIKTALMPIIGKVQDYLAKVGIVIGSKDKPAVTINNLLDPDSGNKMLDVYQGLGTGMQRIVLKDVDKDQKSVMGDNLIINNKDKFSGLVNVLPTIEEGKDIPTAIRNLFKQPFMEFNYSAGLRSIRRSLALELAHKAAEQGMKSEKDFKELGLDKITGMRYEQFEQEMLDTNLEKIKIDAFGGKGLELVLATAMDLMYGTQIEATFQREFAPAIQAQGVINQAYQAMFKMFAEVYKVRLAKLRADNDGVVTVVQYKKLMTDLRKMFPTVKGPLSEGYKDSVAIYSTKTGTARDVESGAPASQVHINKAWAKKNGLVANFGIGNSTHTLQYEIKKFEQAMSAGSVIPIHYFDGALMALTAEEITTDLTMIHDAIMPKLTELFTTAKSYNKSMYEKTLGEGRYKIIDELLASLVSVKKEVEAELGNEVFDDKEVKVIKRTLNDDITKTADAETLKLDEYLKLAEDEVKTLASNIDTAFTAIKNDINRYGAAVSHLVAGAEEGTYVVDGQEKAKTKVEDDTIQEDSKELIFADLAKILSATTMNDIKVLMEGCK